MRGLPDRLCINARDLGQGARTHLSDHAVAHIEPRDARPDLENRSGEVHTGHVG